MLKNDFNIHIDNQDLLDEAFTQASYVNEHKGQNLKFYERLEFLGDAVLQLIVSSYIFKRYPKMPQGRLTRLRAAMVNEKKASVLSPGSVILISTFALDAGKKRLALEIVTHCSVISLNHLSVHYIWIRVSQPWKNLSSRSFFPSWTKGCLPSSLTIRQNFKN